MELFIFWIGVNALIGYAIGKQKNEVGAAIGLSILLGPIGWLIALVVPGKVRKCPYCAESVKPEAKVCRYCHRELPAQGPAPPKPTAKPVQSPLKTNEPFPVLTAGIILVSLVLLTGLMAIYAKYYQKNAEPRGDTAIHEHVIHDGWPTSQPIVPPAKPPQQISYPTLSLIKQVDLKDSVGRVVAKLQPGQSLQYIYRDDYQALVRYEGRDYEIRISATDLK